MNTVVIRLTVLSLLLSLVTAIKPRRPQRRCSVDVCFAVDGSGAMSDADFEAQKAFVDHLSWLVGRNSKAGAVQFGMTLTPIAPMTASRNKFRIGLYRMRKRGGRRAFAAAGLAFCVKQLGGRPHFVLRSTKWRPRAHRPSNHRKVIVLLHNGKRGFGSGSLRGPLWRFRGKVFAVAAGSTDRRALAKITGDWGRVFVARDFAALMGLAGVVAKKICRSA